MCHLEVMSVSLLMYRYIKIPPKPNPTNNMIRIGKIEEKIRGDVRATLVQLGECDGFDPASSLLVNLVPFVHVCCAEYGVVEDVEVRCLFNKLANECVETKPFMKWKLLAGVHDRYFA